MKSRFLVPARDEFLAAVDFYEDRAAGLGNELIGEVEYAIEIVLKNPEVGSSFTKRTRRILLRRFPYSVIYIVEQKILVIVAVAHQRQRPGYWKGRL